MSREEQYFPRGKVAPPSTSGSKLPKRKDTDDLFKVLGSSKKKKTKRNKAHEVSEEPQENEEVIIEPSTHKTIQQGMVLLGVVHYVQENNLRVAIPGCVAQLPLNQLSNSYNSLVQRWASDPSASNRRLQSEPHPEKLMRLDAMYKVGHIMKVAVQSKSAGNITVSAMCSEVNGSHTRESLRDGMILQAAVNSVEDYGYGIELGIKELPTAFVSANKFSGVMYVGQVFLVRVKKNHGGRLKFVPYLFEETVKGSDWNMNNITPGMVAEGTIIQSDENGLCLALFDGSVTGCVEPRQVVRDANTSVNTKIRVVLMYTHPILNTVYCSMRVPPVDPANPFKEFHGLSLGQLVKKAIVVQVSSTFVKLEIPIKNSEKSVYAIATKVNVSDDETVDPSDIFSVGQVAPCRVIGMSLIEGELYVSLRHSVVVEGCYYTEDDLYVGRVLPAKVKYTNETGIVFELCPGIIAFCDFAEASFVVNKNNVAEMYPAGKPVQVAIRYINGKHYPPRYFVTCNKQLVKSKHEIIQKYDEENLGKISDGIVLMTKRRGLLVGFYNKVRGWVPEEHLPHSASRADQVYRVGQVVTAKVINVTPEASRMTLSLRYADTGDEHGEESVAVEGELAPVCGSKFNFQPKTDLEGVVIEKDKNCLKIMVEGFGKSTIPKEHLSDFSDLSKLIWQQAKIGTTLDGLATFGVSDGTTIFSMKPYVGHMFSTGEIKIAENSILPGVVKAVGTWGVTVDLPSQLSARILTRDLSDSFIPKDQVNINEGSTLVCKLTSSKEPFTATCKKSAINYSPDTSYNESLTKTMKRILSFDVDDNIGRVVKVTPQKIESSEIICDYKGSRAIASASLTTEGQLVSEQPTNAIILGYRFNEGRQDYVVSIDRDVVYKYLQVVRRSKKASPKMHVKCKAEVLLLAVLKDYAVSVTKDGRLLFLTLRSHFNDVRLGEWCAERTVSALPRFVKAYIYDMANGAVAVGNFCRSDSVSTIEVHTVTKLGEEIPRSDELADREAASLAFSLLFRSLDESDVEEHGHTRGNHGEEEDESEPDDNDDDDDDDDENVVSDTDSNDEADDWDQHMDSGCSDDENNILSESDGDGE